MQRTLNINDEPAKTGNVEIQADQAETNAEVQIEKKQSDKNARDSRSARLQASQQALTTELASKFSFMEKSTPEENITSAISLASSIGAVMSTNDTGLGKNYISALPSYISSTPLDEINEAISKKIETYEQFTGISQDRPEIVLVTDFKPLYQSKLSTDNDKKKFDYKYKHAVPTDAGKYFDAQSFSRNLKVDNSKKLFKVNKETKSIQQKTKEKSNKFQTFIDSLTSTSGYLLNISLTFDRLRQRLDLRDTLHDVTPDETLRRHLVNYSLIKSDQTLNHLSDSLRSNFLSKYDFSYALNLFGYDQNKVKNKYISTKIWLQLLNELKNTLTTHSLSLLDISYPQLKTDNNPIKILKTPDVKRFQYSSYKSIESIDSIKNYQREDGDATYSVDRLLQKINETYNSLYENVSFKNVEARIASLTNLISKEYRYSRGLGDKKVRDTLNSQFGYEISTNNTGVFDYIIGNIGDSAIDFPSNPINSLVAISQKQPEQNVKVLPLESIFIEGDSGNLLPGSSYYVDSSLVFNDQKFDTSKLKELSEMLYKTDVSFNTMVNGMNLLASEYVDDASYNSSELYTKISNPNNFFSEIRKAFLSDNGLPTTLLQRDVMTSVFSMAHDNAKLRSLLFMYIISVAFQTSSFLNVTTRISTEVFNKAQTFSALNQAIDAAYKQGATPTPKSQIEISTINKSYYTTRGQLNDSLIKRSDLVLKVSEILRNVINAFKLDNLAIENNVTRYGGHMDTIIAMTVFDAIISIINAYGNKHIVGLHSKDNEENLIVQERIDNHTNSVHEINGKLTKETVLIQHGVLGVLNTITKLKNSIDNSINYVNSENSLNELRRIFPLFENNLNLLHMLFSEQQIRLFSNAVSDIQAALRPNLFGASYPADADNDGDFDYDDEIKILDDAVLTPVMKDAIERTFSQDEFVAPNALGQKLFTIGIPQGFLRQLQQKVDVKKIKKISSYVKQNDIIKIKVYKIDLLNPDVVYKPKDFLFEMSRFPVRNNSLIKSIGKQSNSLADLLKRFPTRDYTGSFIEGGSLVQYFQAENQEGSAFSGNDYSFLSESQKYELYKNHVLSYLFEVYIKVMTGISTTDYHFDIVDQEPAIDSSFTEEILNNDLIKTASNKLRPQSKDVILSQEGNFFKQKTKGMKGSRNSQNNRTNPAGTAGVSPINALSKYDNEVITKNNSNLSLTKEQALGQISTKDVKLFNFKASVLNETMRMLTPQSDPLMVSKRLMMPKQFDRVFNFMIDPQSFEINTETTSGTPHGKQALEQLIKRGEIVPASNPETSHNATRISTKRYVPKRKNISEGDLVFDKYIIAVETFGDEE